MKLISILKEIQPILNLDRFLRQGDHYEIKPSDKWEEFVYMGIDNDIKEKYNIIKYLFHDFEGGSLSLNRERVQELHKKGLIKKLNDR